MTYTCRGGKKLDLQRRPDAFVARVSSGVRARTQDLDSLMARSRALGPTHHAYQMADMGEDFLITDRVFVTFEEDRSVRQAETRPGQGRVGHHRSPTP